MTDKEKLHQILSSLWKNDDSVGKTYYNQALQDAQIAIDSLQEEPVSDDLKKVTELYTLDDSIKPWRNLAKEAFKAGAKWQKEQMMKEAIDGYVIEDIEEGNGDFLLSCEYLPKNMGLVDKQKVKVIVIKED